MTRPALRTGTATLVALATAPWAAGAQAPAAVAGAALGVAAGTYVSMAVIAGQARTGRYHMAASPGDWQLLPVPLAAAALTLAGADDGERVWRAAAWGSAGAAGGMALGFALGRWAWEDRDGAWAGALLGGAAGLLAAGVAGALRDPDELEERIPLVSIRVPAPW